MSFLCWGPQLDAASRCGLTSAPYKGIILPFALQAELLATFAAMAHQGFMFNSLSTTTPKALLQSYSPALPVPNQCFCRSSSSPGARLDICPRWTSWGCCWPIPPASLGPCGWQLCPLEHISQCIPFPSRSLVSLSLCDECVLHHWLNITDKGVKWDRSQDRHVCGPVPLDHGSLGPTIWWDYYVSGCPPIQTTIT